MEADVAVVGAGVSGLAAACMLRRRGWRVAVLERQSQAGGKAISERIGQFLMEHGPSSINGASVEALRWSSHLDLESQRVGLGPGVRRRYLASEGRLHGIATHPLGFFTSNYLSRFARLRLLVEISVPQGKDTERETVAEFCSRRFGREFADRVIDPLVGGLLAGDPRELAMASVFPAIVAMEQRYRSVIVGALRARLRGGKMPARQLFSWRDGIGMLPARLAAVLRSDLKIGVTVRRIQSAPNGFRIDLGPDGSLSVRAVLLATSSRVAACLLEHVDAAAAEAAAAIEAPPLAIVFFGYRRHQIEHPLDGIGYLSPSGEGRAISGALFSSTMFECRAAPGDVALTAYIGGARTRSAASLSSADLVELARADFRDLLGARGEPIIVKHRLWRDGLPQYKVGHDRTISTLRGAGDRQPGLFVLGNYLRGVSVAACLQEAADTCNRADRFLHLAPIHAAATA